MTDRPIAVSVLDLIPVRTDQTTADALAASIALAKVAESVGVYRYWLAEHHNMPAVASTNPPVLIALVASATSTMRVGSGGVMLPNHSPYVVAEQFALLEAAFPGRIDVGIGRAPGTDAVTSLALRHGSGGVGDDSVAHFDQYVADIITLMDPDGATINLRGRNYPLRATPHAATAPPVWLLGSSDYSARLAARFGLPYVFATHFATGSTSEALDLYRSQFVPGDEQATPTTFVTANVVVAETAEEARRLAEPQVRAMVALRTGQELRPQLLVDDAAALAPLPAVQAAMAESMTERWIVDEPDAAARRLIELAGTYGVDEVMVHPVAGATAGTPPDRAPAREQTLVLLAEALDRAGRA